MKVIIIQRRLAHYRVDFFEKLRQYLEKHNIDLVLLYGESTKEEESKSDASDLKWGVKLKNHYISFPGFSVCWARIPTEAKSADMIIIPQENSYLANYPILLGKRFSKRKVAFWGHGANFQSNNSESFRESFKKWLAKHVDWWFAYTDLTAHLVESTGFPASNITVVQNAIDTKSLSLSISSIKKHEIDFLRSQMGLTEGRTGIYVGSLYSEKRLDFLFAALDKIYNNLAGFSFIIVGDGPERNKVEEFCSMRAWCHFVGVKKGRDKAKFLALSDLIINPGLVGLGILDGFVAGIPLITTRFERHSPEIAYLKSGENGVISENNLEDFVSCILYIINEPNKMKWLGNNARKDADYYTIEEMVRRFGTGILRSLSK